VGEAHAPVVAVLVPAVKKSPDEAIPAPKGRESWIPRRFPLQKTAFLGSALGAIVAFFDPQLAAVELAGEGHAPVVAVLRECEIDHQKSSSASKTSSAPSPAR
jgi:hypothetical protein